jgi:hypothetical protein
VDWSSAKVPPAELPEAMTPPPWLAPLFMGLVALVVVVILRKKSKKD